MITCERCGQEGPLNLVESTSEIDHSEREWQLCETCFLQMLELVEQYIRSGKRVEKTWLHKVMDSEP